MRLKSLSLLGYKSFASRCTFEFADGITAVVGPNGSGKSNVADAIRWVLGEQSYRSLRARTTEDMIFSGSRHRARLGMAEAIITLDNSDHWLPVDYNEVTIGRRAYRSGENEYLLNDSRVRYRDILDLLGAAGLSRTTYTVIGQGMVDAALALRPEARRALFEEAAGISPQLRKREESLERIAETERNLERVADILSELSPRVAALQHQAERAEEHRLLDHDLTELLRIWYGYRWHQLVEAQVSVEQAVTDAEGRLLLAQQRAAAVAQESQLASEELAAANEQLQALQGIVDSLRADAQAAKQQLALSAERQRLFEQQLGDIAADLDTLASRQGILAQEIERAEADWATLVAQRDAAEAELASLAERRAEVEQTINRLQAAVQTHETQLRTTQSQAARQQARKQELQGQIERLAGDALAAQQESEAQTTLLASLRSQMQPLTEAAKHAESALAQADQHLAALQTELEALRDEASEAETIVQQLRAQRSQLTAHRDALARQREESAEYAPGVRHVLSLGQALGGVLGTAAGLMEVPQAYEQAIEAALGSRLQNIVVEHWEDAERAIARLKQDRAGWATFLPLDTLQSRGALHPVKARGVIGVASELVHFPENLRAVYELLLGRTLVTDDLTTARRLLSERTGASLIVTLSGETVQPTGAVSGGARRNASQLLAQERVWRELPTRIAQVDERLHEAEASLAAHRDRAASVRGEIEQIGRERQRLSREREQAQRALSELEASQRVAERDLAWQKERVTRAHSDQERAAREARACAVEIERLGEEERAHTAEIINLRERLAAATDEPLRRRLAELETQLAVSRRALTSQEQLLASHRGALTQNQEQSEAKAKQHENVLAALEEERQCAVAQQAHLASAEEQLAAATARLVPVQGLQAAAAQRQRLAADEQARCEARVREADSEVHRAKLDLERALERQHDLVSEIEGALGPVDLPDAFSHQLRLGLGGDSVALPSVPVIPVGLEQEVRSLRARIRRLGGINPDAPQEYEALVERQAFLQAQMSDLQGAIAALHQVIQELDDIIERDFTATVRTVDQAFGEYFRRLFNGGSAHLELSNPEDLGNTGVEIIAHPPGKRAQTLSLLSGGERALTAVALVFALLKANPVPFCFLDEVDAALDEANVGRFRDMLLEHSRETQFVVITHNRRTIEIANCIYGISMGEQGVSESVSLRLDDEAIARLASKAEVT